MKEIPAGEFKTHCLALMDQVQRTREPIVITKRGKPVAKVMPADTERDPSIGSWVGRVRVIGDIVNPAFDESDWDCLR